MSDTLFEAGIDLGLDRIPRTGATTIATLGPAGTSSEDSATALAAFLSTRGLNRVGVELYSSYEAAADNAVAPSGRLLESL